MADHVYDGAIPVDEEWYKQHIGEEWTFTLFLLLDQLVECAGVDELNEICDLSTGVVLSNLSYEVVQVDPETVDGTIVCLLATGTVEEL